MATSITRNLKLRVNDNLTADAKYNLNKLDELGAVYQVDNTGDVRIRAQTDVVIQPEDSSVGGAGTGGTVTIGSVAAPVDSFVVHADTVEFSEGFALADGATPATGSRLYMEYDSSASGTPAPGSDYTLSLDVEAGDRTLVLGTDVSITGTGPVVLTATGPTTLTLPTSGAIVTTTLAQTLTNKSINGSTNTLTNIPGTAIVPDGQLPYAALDLSDSIVNADVAANAAISYTKLNLTGGVTNADIVAAAGIPYSKLNLGSGIVNADVSPSAAIGYSKLALNNSLVNADVSASANLARNKLAAGNANFVLVNDSAGLVSESAVLSAQLGGTGVVSTAVFPTSGLVSTSTNTATFTNKTLSGTFNSFSNIAYGSLTLTASIVNADISPSAAIGYSKLNLDDSITDDDISAYADISGAKIIPDFLEREIRTSGGLRLDGNTYSSRLYAAAGNSQAAELSFYLPNSYGTAGYVLTTDGNGAMVWQQVSGTGTVTSVALQAPTSVFSVSGSPITVSGTLTLALQTQAARTVWAGPTSGMPDAAPAFRTLQLVDLPALTASRVVATDGSGTLTASPVTSTELGYVSGVTSALQGQLDAKQPLDADLTALSALASTGFATRSATDTWVTRSLTAGAGIDITNPSGLAGNPVIASTVTQYTDELAQDAIGGILADTADIDFTYDDATPAVTAVLTTTGVSAATYGSASQVAVVGVDAKGRITSAASTSIAIASSAVIDFAEAVQDAVGAALTDSTSVDFTYNDAGNTISAVVSPGTMTAKATPVAADLVLIGDSAASNAVKTVTIANLSAAIVPQSFKDNWLTSDGLTKVVTHSLGTTDVIVQVFDSTLGDTILVDSTVRTDANTVTLTSSQAPATSWRVLILKV